MTNSAACQQAVSARAHGVTPDATARGRRWTSLDPTLSVQNDLSGSTQTHGMDEVRGSNPLSITS